MAEAAKGLGVELVAHQEPLDSIEAANAFIEKMKAAQPQGVVLSLQHMDRWGVANHFAANKGDIPTIVFSPMGTSFTGHLGATRNATKCFCAATQDVGWLAFAMRMFKTMWDMKNTRLCILHGDKSSDQQLDVIGTTLHHIPNSRFPDELKKVQEAGEAKALAEVFRKEAKDIKEPNPADVLNAAENYLAARRIMEAENCQGIAMDCLGLVGSRIIPCPPCMAWLKLNDEGSVGACEADTGAAISLLLSSKLFGRPGFMQDPAPNSVNNTLMGAHCSCPTKLDGLDKPGHEPVILRSHSESNIGVSPQVLWRPGQKVTIMKFGGPGNIILGTGKVVSNVDTPPSGGCRTSVELELDGVPDARDAQGFHQLFIYGDLEKPFKAYCQLAGIKVAHI
jgi:hypothetical protein